MATHCYCSLFLCPLVCDLLTILLNCQLNTAHFTFRLFCSLMLSFVCCVSGGFVIGMELRYAYQSARTVFSDVPICIMKG